MTVVYKKLPYKKDENKFLEKVFGYFGPWNYFSMSFRGKGCIAPKLSGARNKGTKTQRGKEQGLHNSAGRICLQSLPRRFWTPRSLPRGVLDPSFFAAWIFEAMQPLPQKLTE